MTIKTVYKDSRGKVSTLDINGTEYIILETKKGKRRGGDYHNVIQYNVVLKGKIKAITTKEERILSMGDSITFKERVPHYFEALEDSIVLEWKNKPGWKKYYIPFRKLVEELL